MITKTNIALVAAFVLGTASAALAQTADQQLPHSEYQRNPNAPIPQYAETYQAPAAQLFEGRNVGIRQAPAAGDVGQRAFEDRLTVLGGPNAY